MNLMNPRNLHPQTSSPSLTLRRLGQHDTTGCHQQSETDPPNTDLTTLKPASIQHPLSKTDLFWTAMLLTWYYCILPRRIRKIYRQQKLLHDEITMILTDTGLESKTPHGGGKLAWALFHKWKRSNKVIIVYQSDVLYNVFPIRAFDKAEDVEWFCGILGGKVGSSAN